MFHYEILRPRLLCLCLLAAAALAPAPCVAQADDDTVSTDAGTGAGTGDEEEEATVIESESTPGQGGGSIPLSGDGPVEGALAEQQPRNESTGPLGAPEPQSTGVPGGTATTPATTPATSSAAPPSDPAPVNAGFEPKSDSKPEGGFQLASAENTRSIGAPDPAVAQNPAASQNPAPAQNPAVAQNAAPNRPNLADAVRENGGWGPQVRDALSGQTDQQLQNRLNALRNSNTGDQLTNGQMRGALEREIFERSRR